MGPRGDCRLSIPKLQKAVILEAIPTTDVDAVVTLIRNQTLEAQLFGASGFRGGQWEALTGERIT